MDPYSKNLTTLSDVNEKTPRTQEERPKHHGLQAKILPRVRCPSFNGWHGVGVPTPAICSAMAVGGCFPFDTSGLPFDPSVLLGFSEPWDQTKVQKQGEGNGEEAEVMRVLKTIDDGYGP